MRVLVKRRWFARDEKTSRGDDASRSFDSFRFVSLVLCLYFLSMRGKEWADSEYIVISSSFPSFGIYSHGEQGQRSTMEEEVVFLCRLLVGRGTEIDEVFDLVRERTGMIRWAQSLSKVKVRPQQQWPYTVSSPPLPLSSVSASASASPILLF